MPPFSLFDPQQVAAQAAPQQAPAMPDLSGLTPDHFSGIADASLTEAETFKKRAEKEYNKSQKWQTISGILGLVGGLASSANQIYQATQGRQGIAIGMPLQQLGTGFQGLIADPAKLAYEQNASKHAISQIPNLTPQMRQGLYASVDAGQKEAGFKGLFEGLKDQYRFQPEEAFVMGNLSPEQQRRLLSLKVAGRTQVNLGDKTADTAALQEISRLQNSIIKGDYDNDAQKLAIEQRITDLQGQVYRSAPELASSEKPQTPAQPKTPPPAGAVGTATGKDGKKYYIDANKKVLGTVQ